MSIVKLRPLVDYSLTQRKPTEFQLTRIAPYDLAEYCYAFGYSLNWRIYREGKFVESLTLKVADETLVAQRLFELDSATKSRIDRT